MQEKDAVSIKYFKDKRRFADLINGHLFGGKEFVKTVKEKCKTSKGGHNVCRAIQDLITEGVQQGFQDGFQDGFQQGELLTRNVFQLKLSGADYEEIAQKCHILVDRVQEILEGTPI
ncbi:MAG: hypothetical protein Q4C91_21855 [Eubacteriales bacterium]|nr:hypothetical protein [Eubacteriales bacterium]